MRFQNPVYNDDVETLRHDATVGIRAEGDNIAMEENVGTTRIQDVEGTAVASAGLAGTTVTDVISYYHDMVIQGTERTHTPSTFTVVNKPALMAPTIDPNQKIIRLEGIDGILKNKGIDFDALSTAIGNGDLGSPLINKLVEGMREWPGARPAFAAFRAEVTDDLKATDWLARLRRRLGLGHYSPLPGQRLRFVMVEYLVKDVLKQVSTTPLLVSAFARPTILESKANRFFFPAPADSGEGYAVDLYPDEKTVSTREFLHVRIDYSPDHVKRIGELVGPLPAIDLAVARDRHLAHVRDRCKRPDYGEMMNKSTPGRAGTAGGPS